MLLSVITCSISMMKGVLKLIFRRTKYLWISSRVVFIAAFSYALLGVFSDRNKFNFVVEIAIILHILGNIIILFAPKVRQTYFHSLLRYYTGAFSIFFCAVIAYLILTLSGFEDYFMLTVPLWMLMFGLYDLTNAKQQITPTNKA